MDLNSLKQIELTRLFKKNERTIQRWHEQGLPRHGEGKGCYYVWDEVLPWYVAFVSGSEGGPEALNDRQRKDKADADMAEMDRDLQAAELLDARDVRRTWLATLGRLRDNLLGLPDRCAPELEDGQVLAERISILRRHMNESLRSVVKEIQEPEGTNE